MNRHWSEWGPKALKLGFVDSVGECLSMVLNLILIALILVVMSVVAILASVVYLFLCFYWVYVFLRTGDRNFLRETFGDPGGRPL